ncbi:NtaA/DmoA family FMN-dependent monooxygenase [Streptomyces sp. NPDC002680]|uniref:NtaA/DmoA family FMN-dependent monooxygenase n=1 Tax=Streptomyces sp. NPDC002680 TaxID=3364659 RepID=UPI0036C355AE
MSGMHIGFDLSFTHTEGAWARPGSWVGLDFPDVRMFMELARTAERAGVGLLFFGDGSGIPSTWRGGIEPAVEWGIQWPRHDMAPVIAAMATVTERIGFGLTYSSTFMHPFYVARLLNSLDHVTGGRIAFNVVASTRGADAANYGFGELMDHDLRYERMEEFVEVCRALWDSVAPDAIVRDRETGRFADPAKVHPIDHKGRFFDVKGPLASVPGPQIHPLIVQAGNSPRGIAASARFADLIFGFGGNLASQLRHRRLLDEALLAERRDPADTGILWATQVIVGRTAAEARARRDEVHAFWNEETVAIHLSHNMGYDLSTLPETFRLGELRDELVAANASPAGLVGSLIAEFGEESTMSRDEFFDHGRGRATGLDHSIVGDAESVADELQENFAATGSRGGYMLSSPLAMPSGLADISELLLPELRRRGALASPAAGATLRENLAV